MTTRTGRRSVVRGGVGESVPRPDGVPKVTGTFDYVSDLYADDMLWAATRRAKVPRARLVRVDLTGALAAVGVRDAIAQADVPGTPYQGQIVSDQPVFAEGEIRHWGEAIAVVAADDPETARRAAAAVEVQLEDLEPLIDLEEALEAGEVFRAVRVRRGDPDVRGAVVIEGTYETAMQDQAPLGTEAGLAVPDGQGGVDIWGPTQWTHVDHRQIVACLGVADEDVRIHPTGIGGAFGAREDLCVQTHLALLALRTGRPVKMVYDRTESFAGHVKRHSARMWYRHEADHEGTLVRVDARLLLDGGAYHMTSDAVIANAAYFAAGAYRCENTSVDAHVLRTNHPPAGAMRGFGANQVCFAVEAQMDLLAVELGIDPMELRLRNALGRGDRVATTGQTIDYPLPTAEVIRSVLSVPMPDEESGDDALSLPGGTGLTTRRDHVTRGVGYAVGIKNLQFSEAFDDYADAEVELSSAGVVVRTAAIEVGQGMVTVLAQIARSVLGIEDVEVEFAHTGAIGSAGSTSASRQTQMSGGAVFAAATALRSRLIEIGGGDDLDAEGVWRTGELVTPIEDLTRAGPVTENVRFRHPETEHPDEDGQGNPHVDFCVAAHRAVVDVDAQLGLVRVVRIDSAQDVGRALNPQSVLGQVEGGIAQGLGLAVMEEVVLEGGVVRNPNFTDYLIPTMLDMGAVESVLVEEPSPWGPFGAKGFAELPTIAATPAIVAAIRAATGRALTRAPVRPEDIVGDTS